MFPKGYLENQQERDDRTRGKYGAIAYCVDGEKVERRTLTDELNGIEEFVGSDGFCFMSPIAYAGQRATAKNARELYAIAIDVDSIAERHGIPWGLVQLWYQIESDCCPDMARVPRPTAVVSSGTGIHLYFMLDEPLELFPSIVAQVREMRYQLTRRIWGQGTTTEADRIQFEGVFQAFRMVGSVTKLGRRVVAWRTGERLTIAELNRFVNEHGRVDVSRRYRASKVSLPEAAKRFPEWYQQRIVEKKRRKAWLSNRGLYEWWKEKGAAAEVGHRYHSMMILAVCAIKSGVGFDELRSDMQELAKHLDVISPKDGSNNITEHDVSDALAAYDKANITQFNVSSIEHLTGLRIERNKRNGRTQALHLRLARAVKAALKEAGEMHLEGRPSKQEIVAAWRAEHPDGRKIDCERETGLSRHTVLKWWDEKT